MKDACIIYNVIKKNLMKKNDQDRKMKLFWPLQAPNGIGIIM
jgi:hypothetical protein